jgi:hypothetical protein
MANQQPDHDRIIEILAGAQAHLRQSFIDLLEQAQQSKASAHSTTQHDR